MLLRSLSGSGRRGDLLVNTTMLIRDVLLEAKSQLMMIAGKDPLGQALASRLHREAIILDGTQVWSAPDGIKALKKLQGLKKWPFKRILINQSFLFRGELGWAAVYVPRTDKDKDFPDVDLLVSTEQGVDVKSNAVYHDKDVKALPSTLLGLIGNIEQVYIIANANQTDLAAMRLKRRTSQDRNSPRPGVRPTNPQLNNQSTDLFSRSASLMPAAGVEIKRYLRAAVRQGRLFVRPGIDFDAVTDMIDDFINHNYNSRDLLSTVSYTDITGWWSKFLKDVAREKYDYKLGAEEPGNNLTATQVVDVVKGAKELLLAELLKRFFRKTKTR